MTQLEKIQLWADSQLALKLAVNDVITNKLHFEGLDHAKEACAEKFEEALQNVKQRIAGIS